MKFSILLPTRNRLDLLRYAVASVQQQEEQDWEIIVSDNASEDDVAGFVSSLGDQRIRYFRSERLIPVTENWNAALSKSTGDYVVMLGDDDGLMRGCLAEATRLIREWHEPEAIYTQAMQYAYPGVIPGQDAGFTQVAYNEFLLGKTEPFLLQRDTALRMVQSALDFRLYFGFNMQHFFVSRALINRLAEKGEFYQSPYPDYYAANAILLAARTIVANPVPLIMIGISPKSFGYFYFNQRESEGVDFLSNVDASTLPPDLRHVFVPGSNMNDSWLLAMNAVVRNFPEVENLKVSISRYRLLQFYAIWRARSWRGLPQLLRCMHLWEMVWYASVAIAYVSASVLPGKLRQSAKTVLYRKFNTFPRFDVQHKTVPYRNLLEAVSQHGR